MTLDKILLCTDVLGTLIHTADPSVPPEDLIETNSVQRYVHRETVAILAAIQSAGVPILLATGSRRSSYERFLRNRFGDIVLPYTTAIIEHGGVILEHERADPEWSGRIGGEVMQLFEYKRRLRMAGIVVDDEGRAASFRIDPRANEMTAKELNYALNDIDQRIGGRPTEIQCMVHVPYPPEYACIEVIPKSSGKENAIEFVLNRMGLSWANVVAAGDDTNDLGMMDKAGYSMTIAGANSTVISLVSDKGGYISQHPKHMGTIDILTHLDSRA